MATKEKPHLAHGRLVMRDYQAADPEDPGLVGAVDRLHDALYPLTGPRPDEVKVSCADALRLMFAVETWRHYASHPADDRSIAKQLADVRRALRRLYRTPKGGKSRAARRGIRELSSASTGLAAPSGNL